MNVFSMANLMLNTLLRL